MNSETVTETTASQPPLEIEARRLHPATLAIDLLRFARSWSVPLLLLLVVGQGGGSEMRWMYALVGFAVLSVFSTFGRFISLRYGVESGRLFVRSGILFRNFRTIPVDRIQNLNFQSGILHRLFDVVDVRIETAGGGDAEASLSAISRADAVTLRWELLARRTEETVEAPEPHLVRKTSFAEILLAGATESRVGFLLASLWGFYELALQTGALGRDADEGLVFRAIGDYASDAPVSPWMALFVSLMGLLLLGWVLSIGAAVLTFAGFEVQRLGRDLKKRHGLFTRVETTIPVPRVQALRLDESLPRRLLGYGRVLVETAGSATDSERGGTTVLAPLLPLQESDAFCRVVFPDLSLSQVYLRQVHPLALRRGFMRALLLTGTPLLSAALLWKESLAFGFIGLLPLLWFWAVRRYQVLGYAHHGRFLVVRTGVIHHRVSVVPEEKIQTVAIVRSPLQRMFGIATLRLATAGTGRLSRLRVIDLGLEDARRIFTELARAAARGGAL